MYSKINLHNIAINVNKKGYAELHVIFSDKMKPYFIVSYTDLVVVFHN
jgi:hypothetical protein